MKTEVKFTIEEIDKVLKLLEDWIDYRGSMGNRIDAFDIKRYFLLEKRHLENASRELSEDNSPNVGRSNRDDEALPRSDTNAIDRDTNLEQDAPKVGYVSGVRSDEVKDRYGKVVTSDEKEIKKGLDKD